MTGLADCLFCGIVSGDVPADIVRTDEHTVAFRDINPNAPVHVLVVPRRHIVNASEVTASDGAEVAALFEAAKAVADAEGIGGEDRGYRLVFNVGPDALNSVDHLHLHVLGGRSFDWPPG
jgi:histidine triad (HIT) family protein